jgi:hypothetical protein
MWWVSFGTAVPSVERLAVARHLPQAGSGGDRHLNFYGNRDNLSASLYGGTSR